MRKRFQSWAVWAGALSLMVSLAPVPAAAADDDRITLSLGAFDLVRQRDDSGAIGLDYRIPRSGFWKVKPWVGLLSTSDQAVWGGAGLYYDWEIGARSRLTPSFGAGFFEDGVGVDLGHTLEFRSQIEYSYLFDNNARIGVNFGHLSNARLSESNPGTEYFNILYSVPIKREGRAGRPMNASRRAATRSK